MSASNGFVKMKRSEDLYELMKDHHAFVLFALIAARAKRTDSLNIHNLEIGEALIGDHESIGLSQQEYRTAKKNLQKWGLITCRSTNRGTIAKLLDKRIFDINPESGNKPFNIQSTTEEQADNIHPTTKKKEKNEKCNNEKKETDSFLSFWTEYPVKTHKKKCLTKWNDINPDKDLTAKIIQAVEAQKIWRDNAMPCEFRPEWPNPYNWLDQERWNDDIPQQKTTQEVEMIEQKQISETDELWAESLTLLETAYPEAYKTLKDNINEHSFSAFIEPLKVVEGGNDTVTLFALPNDASWIQEHFQQHIEEALQKKVLFISHNPES